MRKHIVILFSYGIRKVFKNYIWIIHPATPWFCFPLLNWKQVCLLTFSSDSSPAASFLAKHCFNMCKLTMYLKIYWAGTLFFYPTFWNFLVTLILFFFSSCRWRKSKRVMKGDREREREGRERVLKIKWFEAILVPLQPDLL